MSIRALNQNSPSLNFAANAAGQGPSHPFFHPHGGEHPYSNPWYLQSGNDQPGRPGHPYLSPWAETGDEDQDNGANDNSGDTTSPRKPYPYPGPAEGYPPHNFPGASEGRKHCPFPGYPQQPYTYPGPLPWYQSHAHPGPAEGQKPYPSLWNDEKSQPYARKPYPYPGPADGYKPHHYPGAAPWRQPHTPWEQDDKPKPSFPCQPYQFPGPSQSAGPFSQQPYKYSGNARGATPFPQRSFPIGQQIEPGNRGWGGLSAPHASHGPWEFTQQAPYTCPSTASDKYKPEVDVFDTPEAFVIHVALPGTKREDVEVNWDPKTVEVSISGVINRPGPEDLVKTIALDERKVGAFERKVRLGSRANPPKVDGDAISAKLEDGVLVIEVPKTEPDDDAEVKRVEVE
ncbi:uncharacterized protein N7518_008898 [Penicillium psychrosexuale]|uniref:uncharacterized protein n=1 Tax=Penicillium psychrosexuale TaxID=1002107 RepID=UPI00254571B5|nr:uncharacterized protein N7518_008898 [Penicillium psychrosexuale]KAJ5791887.1 hypothetical protein N7518_008898 [Penicillium psychrosexuale]